jgi:hypothetical protein
MKVLPVYGLATEGQKSKAISAPVCKFKLHISSPGLLALKVTCSKVMVAAEAEIAPAYKERRKFKKVLKPDLLTSDVSALLLSNVLS